MWKNALLEKEKIALLEEFYGSDASFFQFNDNKRIIGMRLKGGDSRILKLHTTEIWAKNERAFQELAGAKGIPVPKVFSLKKGGGFVVREMEKAKGTLALDKWRGLGKKDRTLVVSQIAKNAVELHSIKPRRIPKKLVHLLWDGKKRWGEFVKENSRRKLVWLLNKGVINWSLGESITLFLNKYTLPKSIRQCRLHGDLRLENIFLDESNNVSAIIDWENAFLGPPEYDIARLDVALGKFSLDYSRQIVEDYRDLGGRLDGDYFRQKKAYLVYIGLETLSQSDAGNGKCSIPKRAINLLENQFA